MADAEEETLACRSRPAENDLDIWVCIVIFRAARQLCSYAAEGGGTELVGHPRAVYVSVYPVGLHAWSIGS